MREGRFKLLRAADTGSWELYDLAHDIGEAHDLATSHPVVLPELVQHFEQWQAAIAADPTRSRSRRETS